VLLPVSVLCWHVPRHPAAICLLCGNIFVLLILWFAMFFT
jgi:hypothetical protein